MRLNAGCQQTRDKKGGGSSSAAWRNKIQQFVSELITKRAETVKTMKKKKYFRGKLTQPPQKGNMSIKDDIISVYWKDANSSC